MQSTLFVVDMHQVSLTSLVTSHAKASRPRLGGYSPSSHCPSARRAAACLLSNPFISQGLSNEDESTRHGDQRRARKHAGIRGCGRVFGSGIRAGARSQHARGNHRHRAQGRGKPAGDADRDHRHHRQRARRARRCSAPTMLDQLVPNLQFANNAPLAGNNSSSQVFIRGIGQTDPTSTVDPGVGLYIDDVYIGNAVGGSMALRDIANVQVLRGPQGTLFGRNTIGGAVLMTTTDPGDEFGGEGSRGARRRQSDRRIPRARYAVRARNSRRAGRWACASRMAMSRVPTAPISATPTRSPARPSGCGRRTTRFARRCPHRLHQVRRERQSAGIRGHERRRDFPARRESGCRVPGSHRGAVPPRTSGRRGADDRRSALRQRSAGRGAVRQQRHACRCTARSRTSARRSISPSI